MSRTAAGSTPHSGMSAAGSGPRTGTTRYRIVIADPDTGGVIRLLREAPHDIDWGMSLRYPLGRFGEAPWVLLWVHDGGFASPPGDAIYRVLDLRTGELLPDPVIVRGAP